MHAMNKTYCDEILKNLTISVTECIFVGYAIRRRSKQTIAFLALTLFTICYGPKIESQMNIKTN